MPCDMGKTFIRVAEVWVPSTDGHLLELAGGLFDEAPAFGAISRTCLLYTSDAADE